MIIVINYGFDYSINKVKKMLILLFTAVTLRRIIKNERKAISIYHLTPRCYGWITSRINFLVESVERIRMFWDVATRIIKVANKLLAGIRTARWFTEYRWTPFLNPLNSIMVILILTVLRSSSYTRRITWLRGKLRTERIDIHAVILHTNRARFQAN